MSEITEEQMQSHLKKWRASVRQGIKARKKFIAEGKESNVEEAVKEMTKWEDQVSGLKIGHFQNQYKLVDMELVDDKECQRVDIIVLKYKIPRVERVCLELFVNHTDWPHKLTWYDSRNQSANFSKLWNHLTDISTCEYILIADSDVYVCKNWLSKMMDSFQSGFCCYDTIEKKNQVLPENVGLVVPVTRYGGAHTIQGLVEFPPNFPPFLTDEQVSGFFFLFKKQMWREIGGFDERFYLHGQDSEWMDRVVASDWQIVVRPDVFVDHEVSASINQSVEDGEINYEKDLQWTKFIYDVIRAEKKAKIYEPPKFK